MLASAAEIFLWSKRDPPFSGEAEPKLEDSRKKQFTAAANTTVFAKEAFLISAAISCTLADCRRARQSSSPQTHQTKGLLVHSTQDLRAKHGQLNTWKSVKCDIGNDTAARQPRQWVTRDPVRRAPTKSTSFRHKAPVARLNSGS